MESAPRAIVFCDGQNLYHRARLAFGITRPNFDLRKLAELLCTRNGWELKQARFYTGIPSKDKNPRWHRFWEAKLAQMGRDPKIFLFTRELQYVTGWVEISGKPQKKVIRREKGIDVRIAIDSIRLAHKREYDVALFISEDADLSRSSEGDQVIGSEQGRRITVASAFPQYHEYRRGIPLTERIPIDQRAYHSCIDERRYG